METISRERVPAEILVGGNLESELEYGNYRNALKNGREVFMKAATDVVMSRFIMSPVMQVQEIMGLRVSSDRMVDKNEKLWVTQDLTVGGRGTAREEREARGQEAVSEPEGRSVNDDIE